MRPATRPEPLPDDAPHGRFVRGLRRPRGVVWFGIRSFWGHLQHFVASAIATEDIDSRDWMQADRPERLATEIARHLSPSHDPSHDGEAHERLSRYPGLDERAPDLEVSTITEAIDRDLWIDFVSDTGDDAAVSEAVARMIFARYLLPDGEREIEAPRGDVLFFGGDTAYPVATAGEIHDRVVVPFNRVLREVDAGAKVPRVLLGVPGNHDWYDGLDGFGRLFRRRIGELSPEEEQPSLEPEHETRLEHVVQFVEKFVIGGQIDKQRVLVLDGYVPFQHASYFALPLAPGIDLLAVDRQLRGVDFRQRKYFARFREGRRTRGTVVVLPDPVDAFLEPSKTGVAMARALELDLDRKPHLVLAGDIHHYARRTVGATTHVTAGGGGAFLHPARLGRQGLQPPEAEFPGPRATRALLWQVPWHVTFGRAGFVPHVVLFGLFAPALGVGVRWGSSGVTAASIAAGVFAAIVFALIGGIRNGPKPKSLRILAFSAAAGIATGLLPVSASALITETLVFFGVAAGARVAALLTLILAIFGGAFAFGAYLSILTALGLESTQAFTCLGHPGFKHFVRMRVRRDGSAVDGWCIGLVDPLRSGARPVLVDHFTWRPTSQPPAPDRSSLSGTS